MSGACLASFKRSCPTQSPSVAVVWLLLESGGAEQLQVKTQNGCLPMHFAACKNSSVDVVWLNVHSQAGLDLWGVLKNH